MVDPDCPVQRLLRDCPYPLGISDIATTLRIDEVTAALVFRELEKAGRIRRTGSRYEILAR